MISFASTRDSIILQADTFRFPVDVYSLNIEIRAFFFNLASGGGGIYTARARIARRTTPHNANAKHHQTPVTRPRGDAHSSAVTVRKIQMRTVSLHFYASNYWRWDYLAAPKICSGAQSGGVSGDGIDSSATITGPHGH